jgi:multidrug efflux pump subunit AcrA (membrane-fusion protein)
MRFIVDATHFVLSFKYREINWKSWKTWGVIGAVALALWGIVWTFPGGEEVVEEVVAKRQVPVASVAELMGGSAGVSAVAEIKSVSEAKITTEQGGRIVRVSATLGSRVGAGQILAEVENASQRAAVLQAEGIYEASKASLSKIKGGTREEQLAVLEAGYESAKGGVVTSLLSAYATVDSAVKDTADQMFSGIELGQVQFTVLTSNQTRESDLENRRIALSPVLSRQAGASKTINTSSDLNAELDLAEKEVRDARTFIDILIAALNDAIPSDSTDVADIAAFKAAASGARSSLTGTLSSITGVRAGLETSKKGLEQGVEGAQSQDLAAAEASVKQAQGAYNGALAALEKTIIRSPISGTLNNFTVKLGDIVSPSQQVAIVSKARRLPNGYKLPSIINVPQSLFPTLLLVSCF